MSISTTLSLDQSPFMNALRAVEGRLAGFRNTAATLTAAFTGISAIGPAIASAFGSMAAPIGKAASVESLRVAMETLLGDAGKARDLMAELTKLGAETPFEMADLAPAAKSLLAFGVSADQVVGTLRRIGDIASGVNAPIGDIAEIFGKAKVQGRLFAEDVNQLTGRGINVIKEFANQFKVSEGEVRGLVEAGKIGFPQLERAFISLTSKGGTFEGMMQKQAGTWNGLVSTLSDGVTTLQTKFGQPLMEALKPQLSAGIQALSSFEGTAKTMGTALAGIAAGGISFAQTIGSMLSGITGLVQKIPFVGSHLGAVTLGFVILRTVGPAALRTVKAGVDALSISMIRNGGAAGAMSAATGAAFARMAVAGRVAWAGLKAAALSSGIGAILVGVGYALDWVTTKFRNLIDAGKGGQIVDAETVKQVQALRENMMKLDSQEGKKAMGDDLDAKLQAAEAEADAAKQAGDVKADALQRRATALRGLVALLKELPDAQLKANAATNAQTEAAKEAAAQDFELKKALKKEREDYAKAKAKAQLEAMPIDAQIQKVQFSFYGAMPDGNFYKRSLDLAGIEKEIARIKDSADAGSLAYQKKLLDGATLLLDLNQKRTEAMKKAAEADANHGEKVSQLKAELAGNNTLLMHLRTEEKIRERIKQLKDAGVKNADAKGREEVRLEQQLSAQDATTEHQEKLNILRAQLAENGALVRSLEAEAKVRERIKQLTSAGVANPERMARQEAAAEQAIDARKIDEFRRKSNRDLARMRAEMRGDSATVAKLKREEKVEGYEKEALALGVDPREARRSAEERATAEAMIEGSRKTGVADSSRRVGLGGLAFGGSTDPLVKAQRDATKETRELATVNRKLVEILTKPAQAARVAGAVFK